MNTTGDKVLQDAKKANQKSRQGNMSGFSSSNDPSLQETKQLNAKYASANTGSSSSSSSGSSGTSGTEEAKELNQQSRQNKK